MKTAENKEVDLTKLVWLICDTEKRLSDADNNLKYITRLKALMLYLDRLQVNMSEDKYKCLTDIEKALVNRYIGYKKRENNPFASCLHQIAYNSLESYKYGEKPFNNK